MKNTPAPVATIVEAFKQSGNYPLANRQTIEKIAREHGHTFRSTQETFMQHKVGRGCWDISRAKDGINSNDVSRPKSVSKIASKSTPAKAEVKAPSMQLVKAQSIMSEEIYIPQKDSTFVPWGEFRSIRKIIAAKQFFPLYISGMSGNGKTMNVEQACALEKREYIRVQISPETDEDDLIGGFRLINGETVFQKGPVIKAMEAGAILLIDEIDRGSNKIMCLQGVLEGKPVLIKKIGETIFPAPGFNVIATANTAGRGSEDGRYVAAQIIDDAFLERFVASIDQPYPEFATELKIVQSHMKKFEINGHDDFAEKLTSWSAVIRKTYADEGVDEVISTRRLCHIVKAFGIFNDRLQAIKMCINRFDAETREAFLDLYTKLDNGQDITKETVEETAEEVPF